MTDFELEIVRKNTRTLTVTVTDSDGVVVNLTGYTMKLTVKRFAEDTDANAVIGPITATIAAPAAAAAIPSTFMDLFNPLNLLDA